MNKSVYSKALAVFLALLLWQIIASIVHLDLILVSPWKVFRQLAVICTEPGFRSTVFYSIERITIGFLLAFVTGILFAIAASRFPFLETLLWPYVASMKSVPVASFIIISLIWLRADQLAIFISFLMVFPILYTNVLQGIRTTDSNLLEMATMYKVPWKRRLLYIYLPNIRPYLLSACSVSLGLAWKSGIAAEVIGVVSHSIGMKLYEAKIYLMTADLFAWTIVIVIISVVFEHVFLFVIRFVLDQLEKL